MESLLNVSDTIPPADRGAAVAFFARLFGELERADDEQAVRLDGAMPRAGDQQAARPLVVELGSGNGHFLAEYAAKHREKNFVGTEILSGRARKLQAKVGKRNLPNVVVFRGEVRRFVWEFLYEEMVEEFITLFPDPWPKKRHHKHRLLNGPFFDMLRVRLVQDGVVSMATDSAEYRDWILGEIGKSGGFTSLFEGGYSSYPADYPETLFLKRFKEDGREVNFMRFRKKKA
jgi:tRNA (guanine-N7-)-methyltransferase